jgi:hypothetical protein
VRVRRIEGVAIHDGPEPCVGAREGEGEASVGECIGQPLSRERLILGADTVTHVEGKTDGCASASAWTARRGLRTWHVRKLLVREPGDLGSNRRCYAGSYREGEEP